LGGIKPYTHTFDQLSNRSDPSFLDDNSNSITTHQSHTFAVALEPHQTKLGHVRPAHVPRLSRNALWLWHVRHVARCTLT